MPVCEAIVKKTGSPCTKASKDGLTVCGIHAPRAPRPPPPAVADEVRCVYVIHGNSGITRRCENREHPDSGHHECRTHHKARVERERREVVRQRRIHVYMQFGMHIWQFQREVVHVGAFMVRTHIVERILAVAGDRLATLEDVWAAMDAYRAEHPPPPEDQNTRLARIVTDSQNVHTREVSEQHNKNMAILLGTPVPEGQKTIPTIMLVWSKMYKSIDHRIYEDMQSWYDKEDCRVPGDRLYRRTLDHLVARILLVDSKEKRRELFKRLQQECAESYNLCCDGHLNRLTNVMAGFDDAFEQEIPKGLILQTKMAEIAKIEDVEERFKAATALFAELKVGHEEAGPWLDAISE